MGGQVFWYDDRRRLDVTRKIRWGILSTGKIAHSFAQGLRHLPDAELAAVGSRTQAAADRFGDRFSVARRHGSYEALAADPDVDVIYIGTPHNLHCENTIMCLEAGKAVLCEKPFAINAAQAERMIAAARRKNLFLMEAMWTRFLPSMIELRRLVAEGIIGDIQMIEANFGFPADFKPEGRLFNPELGGGALLDLGIYPLSFAYYLLGRPSRIQSMADLGSTGVDERAGVILGFPKGQIAVLHFSLTADMPCEATIMGTKGRIRVHAPIFRPEKLTISRRALAPPKTSRVPEAVKRIAKHPLLAPITNRLIGPRNQVLSLPHEGNGYNYEAAEVMRAVREGRLESPRMPLDESLDIMRTMDRIRAPWGLKYPVEQLAKEEPKEDILDLKNLRDSEIQAASIEDYSKKRRG
jgi:predicted dehydrogenase